MAEVLVQHNQATSDVMSWANLKARHLGWSDESMGMWFKRDDGTAAGEPILIPSTIGQGMGRRVTQLTHGFVVGNFLRRSGATWVLAQATTDHLTLATHVVVRVLTDDTFEIAQAGAWDLGGSPEGPQYLSTTPGQMTTTAPSAPVITQRVAVGDGTSLHLTMSGTGTGSSLPVDFQDFKAPVLNIVKDAPASPNVGDRYLVFSTPNPGTFEDHANEIATWTGSTWTYEVPEVGWVVTNKANGVPYYYTVSNGWRGMFSGAGFTSLADPSSYITGELVIWDGENSYSYDPVEPRGRDIPVGKTYGNAPATIAGLKAYYGVSGRTAQNDGWAIYGFNPAGVDGAAGHGIMTFMATDDGAGAFGQGFLFVSGNGPGCWKELLYMEDGWGYQLFQLPDVPVLATNADGKLVNGSAALIALLDDTFMALGGAQTATGLKTFDAGLTTNHVTFDTTPTAAPDTVGTTRWSATEHTIETVLENGSILQHGLEELIWVQNDDTVPLVDGMLVYVSGAAGDNPRVRRASTADTTAFDLIAMVTQPIAVGAEGFVCRAGRVRSLDTSAAAEGAKVYLSTNGLYSYTAPTKPTPTIQVGWVLRSHAINGVVLFSPKPAHLLADSSDVDLTGAPTWAMLYRNASGVWEDTDVWLRWQESTKNLLLFDTDGYGLSMNKQGFYSHVAGVGTTSAQNGDIYLSDESAANVALFSVYTNANASAASAYTDLTLEAGGCTISLWASATGNIEIDWGSTYVAIRKDYTLFQGSKNAQITYEGTQESWVSTDWNIKNGGHLKLADTVRIRTNGVAELAEVWSTDWAGTGYRMLAAGADGHAVPRTAAQALGDIGAIGAIGVTVGGSGTAAGKTINFIQGTNMTIAAVDQGDVVDVTLTAAGGSVSADKYASTMDLAAASANVGVQVGSASQWAAHATLFIPRSDMTLVRNTSKMAMVCPQPVSGASYILAIYKWPTSGSTCDLVATTSVNTMPGSSSWLEATLTNVVTASLVGGARYFMVILWNGNGAQVSGVTGANLNVQPYIAFFRSNLGTLTAAPSTLTPETETNVHLFMRVAV